jgi:hypothetical protein
LGLLQQGVLRARFLEAGHRFLVLEKIASGSFAGEAFLLAQKIWRRSVHFLEGGWELGTSTEKIYRAKSS